MFRGNHPTRVDEKGRLKVPAEFKRLIDEKYGNEFYITSLDGKVAQVYPFEEWQRIEAKLARLRELIRPQPGEYATNIAKIAWERDPWQAAVRAAREGKPVLSYGVHSVGVTGGYG